MKLKSNLNFELRHEEKGGKGKKQQLWTKIFTHSILIKNSIFLMKKKKKSCFFSFSNLKANRSAWSNNKISLSLSHSLTPTHTHAQTHVYTQSPSISLSLSLLNTHTHAHTHTHTHAHTHTHTHAHTHPRTHTQMCRKFEQLISFFYATINRFIFWRAEVQIFFVKMSAIEQESIL